jgi:hypothetical protein
MGGGALVAAALCGGCSILFHADAIQCSSTTDCTARGSAFTGYSCNQGTCIPPQCLKDNDCVTHDASASSLVCSTVTFTCVKATPVPDAGSETGVVAEAGVDAGPTCNVNSDCTPTNPQYADVACDVDNHRCLQLTSAECPLVIGDLSATSFGSQDYVAPGTFIGTFIVIPPTAQTSHPSYLNYALALGEFQATGIPVGATTTNPYRVPIGIGCDVETPNLGNAMNHLINDVHVPVLVSALAPADLLSVFNNYTLPNNILTINALADDPTFTSVITQGYLWHMLGQPGDVAPAYVAFMPILERYLRSSSSPQPIGPTAPMKIVTVTSNSSATNGLAAAVENVLTWNGGQTIAQNGASYLAEVLPDSILNGTSPGDPTLVAAEKAVANDIAMFQPNVVISFASDEFDGVIENLEFDLNPPNLPFYLMGPYNVGDTTLQSDVNDVATGTHRLAGVAFASIPPAYQNVLTNYIARFNAAYQNAMPGAVDEENYYDAMYFAIYARIFAGKADPPMGSDLVSGMLHLVSTTATPYDVGPGDQGNILALLAQRLPVQLIGTLGPPNFDTTTGARIGVGDIYCFQQSDAGTNFLFDYDVLRLINSDGSSPDGGSPFTGSFPCYSGIQ